MITSLLPGQTGARPEESTHLIMYQGISKAELEFRLSGMRTRDLSIGYTGFLKEKCPYPKYTDTIRLKRVK